MLMEGVSGKEGDDPPRRILGGGKRGRGRSSIDM